MTETGVATPGEPGDGGVAGRVAPATVEVEPGSGAGVDGGDGVDGGGGSARLRPVLWRLHFLGGFLAGPVVLWLAVTGLLYAWHPQIDSLVFGDQKQVVGDGDPRPLSEQVAAAVEAYPGHEVVSVTGAAGAGETTAVELEPEGAEPAEEFGPVPGAFTAYVDPVEASVTGRVSESRRPDEWLRDLHSNFRLGTGAGTLTELTASLVVVALLTGLYLWWPRSRQAWRRAVVLRVQGLRGGGRRPWRDLHASIGVVVMALLAVIVVTGLTWTEYAGRWVDVAKDTFAADAPSLETALGGDHAEHAASGSSGDSDLDDLDAVDTAAVGAGLTRPFTVTPAGEPAAAWTVAEVDDRWPIDRTSVAVDPATGEVLDRLEFSDQPLLDQATTLGIGFHEGTLFGLANQLLLTALGVAVIAMVITGYMVWWRRRPAGAFGPPPKMGSLLRTVPIPLIGGFVVLLVLLPTLGVAFVAYLVLERLFRLVRRPAPTH